MKKERRFFPLFIAAAALLMVGCSGNECYENHSALPLASFYSSESMRQVNLANVEIYGIGAPGDSVLYSRRTLSEAYLPFRLWQDSTTYVFAYWGLVPDLSQDSDIDLVPADTITFNYELKEWFVSPACGAMYFYDMKSVSHTSLLIDSVAYNEVITNENIDNIRIFFRPSIGQ